MHLKLNCRNDWKYERYHTTKHCGFIEDNIKLQQYVNEIKDAQKAIVQRDE